MDELDSAIVREGVRKRRKIVGFRSSVIYQHARNRVIEPLDD